MRNALGVEWRVMRSPSRFERLLPAGAGWLQRVGCVVVGLIVFWGTLCASAASPHEVIVVTGHTGEPGFVAPIHDAAQRWMDASRKAGHSAVWIGQAKGSDGLPQSPGVESLVELKKRLQEVEARSSEPLWLVLIGHGNAQGRSPKFALEGPDLSLEDLVKWLERFDRPIVVVAGFSGSGAFVKALSGRNRMIVAGTRSGDEENWVRFSGSFADAISGLEADWDGDGQVSVFEAWLHAVHAVERFYKEAGRMVTEHAVLEDSGDGRPVGREAFDAPVPSSEAKKRKTAPAVKVSDGALSRQWSLVSSGVEGALSAEERIKRQNLEGRLAELREQKLQRPEQEYWRDVESVLLELEAVYRAAKERQRR